MHSLKQKNNAFSILKSKNFFRNKKMKAASAIKSETAFLD